MDCTRDLVVRLPRHKGVGCILIWDGCGRGKDDQSTICRLPYPLLKVFTGRVPFSGMGVPAVMRCIMAGERPERPNHPDFTNQLWVVTQQCWDREAHARPGMQEVIRALGELLGIVRSQDPPVWSDRSGVSIFPGVGNYCSPMCCTSLNTRLVLNSLGIRSRLTNRESIPCPVSVDRLGRNTPRGSGAFAPSVVSGSTGNRRGIHAISKEAWVMVPD